MRIFFKKINWKILFLMLFYILAFLLLLRSSYSYLDPDLGWHLKAGEEIVLNKDVPRENFYNYTFTGSWVDHEWLSDWASFKVYSNFGYLSLSLIFSLIIVFSLIILYFFTCRFFSKISFTALLSLQLLGLFASLPSFGVRMQEFGVLFLLLELLIISAFYYQKRIKLLFFLIPLFYLWSCIHGSFLLGFALLFFFFIFSLLFLRKRKKDIFILFLASIVAFIGTLATPYGIGLYSFLGGYGQTFYLTNIQEWLPFYYFPIQYPQLVYLAVLSAFWILYFYKLKTEKRLKELDLWQLFLFGLFLLLALKSRRNFPLTFVATVPFLTKIVTEVLIGAREEIKINFRYLRYLLLLCFSLVIISLLTEIKINNNPFISYCNNYPCQAINFLENNSQYQEARIFNEYGWGGYLLWQYPKGKIFIDGRLPQVVYKDKTFLEEYLLAFKKETNLDEYLNNHEVELVLLKTKDDKIAIKDWEKFIFNIKQEKLESRNYLREYLDSSFSWGVVYQDPVVTVYHKNNK